MMSLCSYEIKNIQEDFFTIKYIGDYAIQKKFGKYILLYGRLI